MKKRVKKPVPPVRRQVHQALRESEERYRTLLAALTEGIVLINAKGKILEANPAAQRMLGLSKNAFLARNYDDPRWGVVHEDGTPSLEEFFTTKSLRTGQAFRNVVVGLRRMDGMTIWLMGNTQPLFHPGEKKPYAVVASFFDMTERKQMMAEIQKLNAGLEQKVQQRTSELTTANQELEAFSYSVSHDLRSPLRAIEGFSRILLEDHTASLNDEGKRLLNTVCKNTDHMSHLIDDLLAFSRISRKEVAKHRVPMHDLAQIVLSQLRESDPPRKIETILQPLPDGMGDAPLLRQVWMNLLSNALKFTRPQSKPRIEVGSESADSEITYYVRDNGVGFNMKYAAKLFGVFQRLHSTQEFEGTGVGLAIVQRIILRHGGRVWAEGVEGRGATIYFALPR